MVWFLSRLIAVVLTVILAIILYPICGIFWILGLLGKIGTHMFEFTNGAIHKLWEDLSNG